MDAAEWISLYVGSSVNTVQISAARAVEGTVCCRHAVLKCSTTLCGSLYFHQHFLQPRASFSDAVQAHLYNPLSLRMLVKLLIGSRRCDVT